MVLASYISAVLTLLVILLMLLSYGIGWYLSVVLTPLVILFMLLSCCSGGGCLP